MLAFITSPSTSVNSIKDYHPLSLKPIKDIHRAIVRKIVSRSTGLLLLLVVLLAYADSSFAQTISTTGSDSTTPKGLAPGTPAGSYELSGFEHINLYNGNLDFHLPLMQVGGRGSAGYTMMFPLNTKKWSVRHSQTQTTDSWIPMQNGWNDHVPGYGPGTLVGRKSGADIKFTENCSPHTNVRYYDKTLTTLTFTTADGTEYDLRDQLNGGQRMPVTPTCPTLSTLGASRGTVFVTADGSAATFISNSVIYDNIRVTNGTLTFSASGVLFLRDGTRYIISAGEVTAIQDRNGNQVVFGYDSYSRVTTITDSLGRTISIDYDLNDPSYGLCDRIHFLGIAGTDRYIYVTKTNLGSALRTDFPATQTYSQLFPDLNGGDYLWTNDPTVYSAVILPNAQSYQFRYNPYGELARVVLPTGGAIEYDMAVGSGVVTDNNGQTDAKEIYRRVAVRRTYKDGTALDGRTVYTDYQNGATAYIEEDNYDGATMKACARHYFYTVARDTLIKPVDYQGFPLGDYSGWNEGRESRTEQYDSDGASPTTLLRSVSYTWQPGSTMGGSDVNPQLVTTMTTIEPSGVNLVSKQTAINAGTGIVGFDQYNNQTDSWEYDVGTGAPST